jgi:hypothetical protein
MAFIRGQQQNVPFALVKRTSGEAFIDTDGTPSVYITVDGGDQAAASQTPVYKGNGQWNILLTGEEIQGSILGIVFTHADVIPENLTVEVTDPPSTPATVVTISSSGTTIVDTYEYYGSLEAGENYFNNKLNSGVWDQATIKERQNSLIEAARLIDKLNFQGDKADSDQNLQFPRNDDTTIPYEIEYAAYEIAIKLLDGFESEVEAQSLGVMSESYTGVRTSYQQGFVNEHLRAGIPSITAWEYLKPFLRDNKKVNLSRIN